MRLLYGPLTDPSWVRNEPTCDLCPLCEDFIEEDDATRETPDGETGHKLCVLNLEETTTEEN